MDRQRHEIPRDSARRKAVTKVHQPVLARDEAAFEQPLKGYLGAVRLMIDSDRFERVRRGFAQTLARVIRQSSTPYLVVDTRLRDTWYQYQLRRPPIQTK